MSPFLLLCFQNLIGITAFPPLSLQTHLISFFYPLLRVLSCSFTTRTLFASPLLNLFHLRLYFKSIAMRSVLFLYIATTRILLTQPLLNFIHPLVYLLISIQGSHVVRKPAALQTYYVLVLRSQLNNHNRKGHIGEQD